MSFIEFITFSSFAWIGSFTPGPNTAIATTTGINHGVRAALPQIVGVPLGFVIMMWIVGAGGAAILQGQPTILLAIKFFGVAYLLMLAWRLGFSEAGSSNKVMPPFTVLQAAAFQFVNPKAWMMLIAAVSTFVIGQSEFLPRMTWMSAGFALPSALSLLMWAWIGEKLRTWLFVGKRLRWFNGAMGISLAITAVMMFLQ